MPEKRLLKQKEVKSYNKLPAGHEKRQEGKRLAALARAREIVEMEKNKKSKKNKNEE